MEQIVKKREGLGVYGAILAITLPVGISLCYTTTTFAMRYHQNKNIILQEYLRRAPELSDKVISDAVNNAHNQASLDFHFAVACAALAAGCLGISAAQVLLHYRKD